MQQSTTISDDLASQNEEANDEKWLAMNGGVLYDAARYERIAQGI